MTFEWGRSGEEIEQAVADYAERAAGNANRTTVPAAYNHVNMLDIVPGPRGESLRVSQPVGDIALGGAMEQTIPSAPNTVNA